MVYLSRHRGRVREASATLEAGLVPLSQCVLRLMSVCNSDLHHALDHIIRAVSFTGLQQYFMGQIFSATVYYATENNPRASSQPLL